MTSVRDLIIIYVQKTLNIELKWKSASIHFIRIHNFKIIIILLLLYNNWNVTGDMFPSYITIYALEIMAHTVAAMFWVT
jgi:hypothetical protein